MAYINHEAFDGGLDFLDTNGTRLDICSSEPTTYGQATTAGAVSLGSATVNTTAAGAASSGTGRSVTVPAISTGTVSTTGTASHWALTNGTDTLLATGLLDSSQPVTATNSFTLTEIEIFIRDATQV